MAKFKCGHNSHNQLIRHHQLNLPFLNLLDLPRFPDKRLTAVQRPKLAEPKHLPRAMIISPDPPTTCGEYSTLDQLDMAGRNKKAELVHSP